MVQQPDFAEGVRALLIDKDKQANWQYAHATHIPSSVVESLFAARWDTHPLESTFDC